MSEFEETGSEETEVGKDEQGCSKRDRGSSEEEKDNNKDSGDDDGEQVCGSQQNQVESEENVVNGDGDGGNGGPGEVDDGEKSKEESEETEAADNEEENVLDKNTQSKVQLTESLDKEENEQHQKVAATTKEEKGDAVREETVQEDLPSKPEDLKPEVHVEEVLLKTDDDKKEDAEMADLKDSLAPAPAKNPLDKTLTQESKESDKTQELSSSVQVKDKAHTLASEAVEKTTDFNADPKSTLPVETEDPSENKAQKTSSIKPMSEGKEQSQSEPKDSQFEAVKDDDKSIQDVRDDDSKAQDKGSSLKSDVKSLPEVGDQKPDSGDKIQTVQTVLAKEKTTVTTEIEDIHQGATESSQVQKSKLFEGSENMNDPQCKVEKENSKSEK